LDGSFPFEIEESEEQQQAVEEADDQTSQHPDEDMPQTHSAQAVEDIRQLNSNQLTAVELRTKHYFNEVPYLEAFISYVVRNAETRFRKKMPATMNTLKKAVDQWLNEPNKEKRKFFFLKVEGLHQAMIRKYGLNWKAQHFPENQRITEAHLLEKLGTENPSGSDDEQRCNEVLLTTVLKQSFYPVLKGAAKEAASIGHKLEVPLCRALFNEVPSLKAAFQVGLVEKKDEPWVKCSADFITISNEDDGIKLEVTEMKVRTSVQTAGDEEERISRVNAINHRTIEADSCLLKMHIASAEEALQLLHHAYSYNSEFVRHIVGDKHGHIISSTRVKFSEEMREDYGRCLRELKDFLLPWAYDVQSTCIPEDVLQLADTNSLKDLVGGRQGLVQQFFMWQGLMKMERPLPPLRRIIPSIHAEWNIRKTASDTITKLIDGSGHQITPPMANINANSLASARMINYALVMCHRLRQFFTSTTNKSHSNLLDYRHAANQRMAYKHTILMAATVFQTMIEKEEKKNEIPHELSTSLAQRVRIQGTLVSEELKLPNQFTGRTPARHARKKYEMEDPSIPQEIHDRRRNCKGRPLLMVSKDPNTRYSGKECLVCGSDTRWKCADCHHFFCMASNSKKNTNREEKFAFFKYQNKFGTVTHEYTQLLCWQQGHPSAYTGKISELSQEGNICSLP